MEKLKNKILLYIAIPALALPGAIGVYHWLLPARGNYGALSASIGIELLYLGVSMLELAGTMRAHGRIVALSAAFVSIAMNVLLDYRIRVPGGLANGETFIKMFDWLALFIACLDSFPLAMLAFYATTMLHQMGGMTPQSASHATHIKVHGEEEVALVALDESGIAPRYECPRCGSELQTASQVGAAKRWGCNNCKSSNGRKNERVKDMEVIA